MDRFSEDVELNATTFEELASALGVQWPDWYRRFVLTLLERPIGPWGWLPGGFIMGELWIVWRDNKYYRTGSGQLYTRPTPDGPRVAVSWPKSYAIVGSCGSGDLLIDTASDDWIIHNIYKEDYCLVPFLNLRDHATSPEEFAKQIIDHNDRRRTPQ